MDQREFQMKSKNLSNISYHIYLIYRVLSYDILRTKVKERQNIVSFEEKLKYIITIYTNKHNISYKQGLNEIFGSFLILFPLDLSTVYNVSTNFINKFLTNYYVDSTIYSLKSTFKLINILLKYHDPFLYERLEDLQIFPELYCTSWILTYFSSKLRLDLLYKLWDLVIRHGDETFLLFFIVSVLMYYKTEILNTDQVMTLHFFSNFQITEADVYPLFYFGLFLKASTPYSFFHLITKLKLFNKNSKSHKEIYEKNNITNLNIMPIYTNELLRICFPQKINCFDSSCYYYYNIKSISTSTSNTKNRKRLCDLCKYEERKVKEKEINNLFSEINSNHEYKLIFLNGKQRLVSRLSNIYQCDLSKLINNSILEDLLLVKEGVSNENLSVQNNIIIDIKNNLNSAIVIPNSIAVNLNCEKESLSAKELVQKFNPNMNQYRYIIITEDTEDYMKYINLNEVRIISIEDNIKREENRLIEDSTNNKILRYKNKNPYEVLSENNIKINTSEKNYSNLIELIFFFNKYGFKHISYVKYGFKDIHEKCLLNNLPISNHYSNGVFEVNRECFFCNQKLLFEVEVEEIRNEIQNLNQKVSNQGQEGLFDKINSFLYSKFPNDDQTKDREERKLKYHSIYNTIESCSLTDFPSNERLINEEIYECLSYDSELNKIEEIVVYIHNKNMNIFLKERDFIPIQLKIELSNVIDTQKQVNINIIDLFNNKTAFKNQVLPSFNQERKRTSEFICDVKNKLNLIYDKFEKIESKENIEPAFLKEGYEDLKNFNYSILIRFIVLDQFSTEGICCLVLFFDSHIKLEMMEKVLLNI